jgi:hypothetical protein
MKYLYVDPDTFGTCSEQLEYSYRQMGRTLFPISEDAYLLGIKWRNVSTTHDKELSGIYADALRDCEISDPLFQAVINYLDAVFNDPIRPPYKKLVEELLK